jgi:hypothetical protein
MKKFVLLGFLESFSMCECEVCKYGRLVEENLASLPVTQKAFFEDMYDRLCNTKNDLHVRSAILDGSWPSAKSILTNSLTKCRDEDNA